ncbi:hypothetical protein [Winogradskyella sp. A3E31]|uniref:hypothetical protein n=1 Tax=Winogradskyella sp. A3E31 TaxID=3349637 RepID=UPI00398B507F
MIEKGNLNSLHLFGICVFSFLSIYEFTSLIEYLSEQVLFINIPNSISILWLPEAIGLTTYILLLVWLVKKIRKQELIYSKRLLATSIFIFLGLILFRFLYSFYGTGLLFESFPEAFDAFHQLREENQNLQRITSFVPTLKYVILATLLLFNKKLFHT